MAIKHGGKRILKSNNLICKIGETKDDYIFYLNIPDFLGFI